MEHQKYIYEKPNKMKNITIMKELFLVNKTFYRTSALTYGLTHELDLKKQEIIIGRALLLLKDLFAEKAANVQKDPKSNTRLQFKGSAQNTPYINHLYEIFKDFCNTPPKISMSKENRTNRKSEFYFVKFWTASLPIFNKFRSIDNSSKHSLLGYGRWL